MIFRFLRRYLRDFEYEQLVAELAETRQALKERELQVQAQIEVTNNDRDKVEPDFLTLMWASVGFAIAIFISAGQKAVEMKEFTNDPELYIWIILSIFALYFTGANGRNTILLTRKYVQSKSSPIYKDYEWYLTTGAILLVFAVLILAFF